MRSSTKVVVADIAGASSAPGNIIIPCALLEGEMLLVILSDEGIDILLCEGVVGVR